MSKRCSRCELTKLDTEFHKGCRYCKPCKSVSDKASRTRHYNEQTAKRRARYADRKAEINKVRRTRIHSDSKHKELIYSQQKTSKLRNPNRVRATKAAYYQQNKKAINKANVEKRRTNLNARMANNLRSRTYHALKHNIKGRSTLALLGCTLEEFKAHLETRFQPGMNWANYGEWHVDHIIPVSKYDLSLISEQQRCFHFTNLQPLWAIQNLKKGNRTRAVDNCDARSRDQPT